MWLNISSNLGMSFNQKISGTAFVLFLATIIKNDTYEEIFYPCGTGVSTCRL